MDEAQRYERCSGEKARNQVGGRGAGPGRRTGVERKRKSRQGDGPDPGSGIAGVAGAGDVAGVDGSGSAPVARSRAGGGRRGDANHDRDGVRHARGGQERLTRLAHVTVTPSSSPDLLVARLDAAALDAALADPDVRSVSSDAAVQGLQLLNLNQTLTTLKQTVVPLAQKVVNPLDLGHR